MHPACSSEKKVALRERKNGGGLAGEELSVGADLVRFGINRDPGQSIVPAHIPFANITTARNGLNPLHEAIIIDLSSFAGGAADKGDGTGPDCASKTAEHWAHEDRLWSRDAGIRVAHL